MKNKKIILLLLIIILPLTNVKAYSIDNYKNFSDNTKDKIISNINNNSNESAIEDNEKINNINEYNSKIEPIKKEIIKTIILYSIFIITQFILFVAVIVLIIKKIFKKNTKKFSEKKINHVLGQNTYKNNNCKFEKGNRTININDVPYYREIPTNRDIFRNYWIIYNYNLGENDFDFFGALLLKWLNNDNIKLELDDNRKFKNIIFINSPKSDNEIEYKLYHYLIQASFGNEEAGFNVDYKLDINEFKSWYLNNYGKMTGWFGSILDQEVENLIKENKITVEKNKNGNSYELKYIVDPSMRTEAIQLLGLKKFLTDFTILKERETMQVKLFNEYLMYATMFGIADKVYSELDDIYPKIIDYDFIEEQSIAFIFFMLK